MGIAPETDLISEYSQKQRLFIKRERIRRALIATKPGESICLQGWEVEVLLKWLKELEKGSAEDGNKKR